MMAETPYLSAQDAIIWRQAIDKDIQTIVTNLAIFEEKIDHGQLFSAAEAAVSYLPRLRQRVAPPKFGKFLPCWEDDPAFTVSNHIHWTQCPGSGSDRDLLDFTARVSIQSFSPDHPLWSLTLVDRLQGGRSALLIRRHHALIDGMGLVRLLSRLTRTIDGEAKTVRVPEANKPFAGASAGASQARNHNGNSRLGELARNIRLTGHIWRSGRPLSSVMCKRSSEQRFFTLSRPITLFRNAAHATNCTVNDVFLASVARGLGAYLASHGSRDPVLRASMPISVRETTDQSSGGNRFVLARFPLPLDIGDAVECIRKCHSVIRDERRFLPDGVGANLGPTALSRMPSIFAAKLFAGVLKSVDIATTNVACSATPLQFAGARLAKYFTYAGRCGAAIMVSLYSYADAANFGINIDPAAVPDCETLVEKLASGFDETLQAVQ